MSQKIEALGTYLTKNFALSIGVIFLFKMILSYVFPITGDEAYFYQWGKYLNLTYYDHSFITGVWVYIGQLLGKHIFWGRLIGLAAHGLIAWFMYTLIFRKTSDKLKAQAITLAYLACPVLFLFFMITTDTPLFLYGFLTALAFGFGFKYEKSLGFIVAGALLGFGLFSKYLIFFVAMGVGLTALLHPNKKKIPLFIGSIFLGLLPFVIMHFEIAKSNCWWPLQFNVFNRAEGKGVQLSSFAAFLFQQISLLTPWLIFYINKNKKDLFEIKQNPYIFIFSGAFLIIGLLSIFDTGLHWGLSLYPVLYLGLFAIPLNQFYKVVALSFVTSFTFGLLVLSLLQIIPSTMKGKKHYEEYVIGSHGDKIHQALTQNAPYSPVLATLAYTTSGIMEYFSEQRYIVFNSYNYHGRNDDLWTNYKTLDQRNFVIVSLFPYNEETQKEYSMYFARVNYSQINIEGGTFYVATGTNFSFNQFHAHHLTKINEQFYSFKGYLPAGKCFFQEKYFNN